MDCSHGLNINFHLKIELMKIIEFFYIVSLIFYSISLLFLLIIFLKKRVVFMKQKIKLNEKLRKE